MTPRCLPAAAALAAAALLLGGCGDDRPYSGPPPSSGYSAPVPAPLASVPAASAPDPLLSGGGTIPTSDPLLGHEAQSSGKSASQNDPLVSADPLAQSDPLKGPSMPTEHSHWLNTETNKAHVAISLNGLRLSSYQPPGTEDITMKLHPGPNTMTVLYTPQDEYSWGSVSLTEGEHEGQAISLAEFRQAPLHDSVVSGNVKPVTKTITFFAK